MEQPRRPKTVKCPNCGGSAVFDPSNAFRPFCSERCKLIDLGEWASERYRVSGEELAPDQSDRVSDDA